MRVGFLVNYRRSHLTIQALRAARALRRKGACVEVRSVHPARLPVDPDFDRVVTHAHACPVDKWLDGVDAVVSFELPDPAHFARAVHRRKKVVQVLHWDQASTAMRDLCRNSHVVVCPVSQCADLAAARWDLRNVRYVPTDPGDLVLSKKEPAGDASTAAVILDSPTRPQVGDCLIGILRTRPEIRFTVIYRRRAMTCDLYRPLREMERTGRIRLVDDRTLTHERWLAEVNDHDLAVWPALWDGSAGSALSALAAGVPVVAYDNSPQNEFLVDGKNSRLAECDLQFDWFEVPRVLTRPGRLAAAFDAACRHKELTRLTPWAADKAYEMHWASQYGWCDLFGV